MQHAVEFYLLHEFSVTSDHSCYDISMSIQVLGCALNDNINAQVCRPVSTTAMLRTYTGATLARCQSAQSHIQGLYSYVSAACSCREFTVHQSVVRSLPDNSRAGKCVVNDAGQLLLLTEGSHSGNICYLQ